MSYINYGIEPAFVERIKLKMKNPILKDRVKANLDGVNKFHLQDPATVNQILVKIAAILGEKLTERQKANIVQFIIDQRIDPKNTFHLLRLWGMFR
ncbi:MAG: stage VI sporulation protein F [Gorillibacterium sp.]|nr:stage VI sporulation protein F [Gorillibacterium sp.]